MTKLGDYPDNNEELYRIQVGKRKDIVEPLPEFEVVTKGQIRQMFLNFLASTPEVAELGRMYQIAQFNLARAEAGAPKVPIEVLDELELPDDRVIIQTSEIMWKVHVVPMKDSDGTPFIELRWGWTPLGIPENWAEDAPTGYDHVRVPMDFVQDLVDDLQATIEQVHEKGL